MRFINYLLSILFVAMLILAYAIGGEVKYFLIDNSESFHAYIEGAQYRVSAEFSDDLRGSVNFIFIDDVEIAGDIKLYRSESSFDDAYKNGEGTAFINGSELTNNSYYFVAEVITKVGSKYIIPKYVEIEEGKDITVSLKLSDSLKFSNLKYMSVRNLPTIEHYLVGSKFSVKGLVISLTYDQMSIDITPDEFQTYGIKTLTRDDNSDNSNYSNIEVGQIISENEIGKKLYLLNRERTVKVFVCDMKVDEDIKHYGDYGNFFQNTTSIDALMSKEARYTFDYFWETANDDLSSSGYGLVPSFATNSYLGETTTIESLGFSLISIIVGIENGWIDKYTAYERVSGTLSTIENLDTYLGLFYKEVDTYTGERVGNEVVSVTDSAQLLTAVLITGTYFGGEIEEKTQKIYKNAKWNFFYGSEDDKFFYDEYTSNNGYYKMAKKFEGQLLVYILSEASTDGSLGYNAYYTMERHLGSYGDYDEFIHTWDGSLAGHLYQQAFIDFNGLIDQRGVDWYKNTVVATYSSKAFSDNKASDYPSYNIGWGLSASDMRKGYISNHGSSPSGYTNSVNVYDGTVPVYSALSSINFSPEASVIALRNYSELDFLQGKYGFYSAFDIEDNWTTVSYNAVEKGLTLTMLSNYKSGMIWDLSMKNGVIREGLEKLGFQSYEYDTVTSATVLYSIEDKYNRDNIEIDTNTLDESNELEDISEE